MLRLGQGTKSENMDLRRPGTVDGSARCVEISLQVNDLRFPRRIGQDRLPGRRAGGEHHILRRADAGKVEVDVAPAQLSRSAASSSSKLLSAAKNLAALLGDLRPQLPQSLEVQVDGTAPQLTAAGR